jgi:hypothetical protein
MDRFLLNRSVNVFLDPCQREHRSCQISTTRSTPKSTIAWIQSHLQSHSGTLPTDLLVNARALAIARDFNCQQWMSTTWLCFYPALPSQVPYVHTFPLTNLPKTDTQKKAAAKHPNALRRIPTEIGVIIFKYSVEVNGVSNILCFNIHSEQPAPWPAHPWPMAPLPPNSRVAEVGPVQANPIYENQKRKSALNPTPKLLAALRAAPDLY